MLAAILIGSVLGLAAAVGRRTNVAGRIVVAVFAAIGLVWLLALGNDDVWALLGAMFVASGIVDLVMGSDQPQISDKLTRVFAVVAIALGVFLITSG